MVQVERLFQAFGAVGGHQQVDERARRRQIIDPVDPALLVVEAETEAGREARRGRREHRPARRGRQRGHAAHRRTVVERGVALGEGDGPMRHPLQRIPGRTPEMHRQPGRRDGVHQGFIRAEAFDEFRQLGQGREAGGKRAVDTLWDPLGARGSQEVPVAQHLDPVGQLRIAWSNRAR